MHYTCTHMWGVNPYWDTQEVLLFYPLGSTDEQIEYQEGGGKWLATWKKINMQLLDDPVPDNLGTIRDWAPNNLMYAGAFAGDPIPLSG